MVRSTKMSMESLEVTCEDEEELKVALELNGEFRIDLKKTEASKFLYPKECEGFGGLKVLLQATKTEDRFHIRSSNCQKTASRVMKYLWEMFGRPKETSLSTQEALISDNFLWKFQKSIDNLTVVEKPFVSPMSPMSPKLMPLLPEGLTVSGSLNIEIPVSDRFRSGHLLLGVTPIEYPFFIDLHDVLNTNCNSIYLQNLCLNESFPLTYFLRSWMQKEKMEKLQRFQFSFYNDSIDMWFLEDVFYGIEAEVQDGNIWKRKVRRVDGKCAMVTMNQEGWDFKVLDDKMIR